MTAPRRPRSAWLLVGLDAVDEGEGPQSGPEFEQVFGEQAVARGRGVLARRPLEQRPELVLEWGDSLDQAGAVAVVPVRVPGGEDVRGDREAGLAELLLGAEPLAVGGEVSEQVRPAGLASLRVEVVVGPPAVGADDACDVLAE
jgi:hypothetical protein